MSGQQRRTPARQATPARDTTRSQGQESSRTNERATAAPNRTVAPASRATGTPATTTPPRDGFGTNSAGSGKHVSLDPKDLRPGEFPWLDGLQADTAYA